MICGPRLTNWHEMAVIAVRAMIEHSCGVRGEDANIVFVFEDNSWATALAIPDGGESARIQIRRAFGSDSKLGIEHYLHTSEILDARLITSDQRVLLDDQVASAEHAAKLARLAALRAEADLL